MRAVNPLTSNTDSIVQTDRAAVGNQPDDTPATGGSTSTGGGGGAVTKIIAGTGIGVSPGTGVGNVTVSNTLTQAVGTVGTIALMRLLSAPANNGDAYILEGYLNRGDGGGGAFYWDSTSTDADNGGTVIKITAVATGRFYRVAAQTQGNTKQGQTIDVRWFGAIPDFATNVASAVMAAYATFVLGTKGACLYFPAGNYLVSSTITITGGPDLTIRGDGAFGSTLLYNIAGAASSLLSCSVSVELLDFGCVSLIGTQANTIALFLNGPIVKIRNLYMKEMPNNYMIKCTGTLLSSGVKIETSLGYCALLQEGGRPVLRDWECAMADGLPVVIIKCLGGASMTSPTIQDGYFKGGGVYTDYDGGVAKIGMVISGEAGTMNEGQFSNFTLDTGGGGNPAGSISLLIYADDSAYGIANFTLSDLWLNSGRCGLFLKGVDVAGTKTLKGMRISNIITRPIGTYGVYMESVRSILINALGTLAVGSNAIGVGVANTGANNTQDIYIEGSGSTVADFQCNYSVEVIGTKVVNLTARVTDLNNTNAYLLSGGAAKLGQDLTFQWNDAAGGVNFSGPVNQNV